MEEYRKYFKNYNQLLEKLERLHKRKYAIKDLIDHTSDVKPFVTEFSGLPRTGKSSSLDRVYNFFKQAGIRIEKTLEPAQLIKESMTKSEISSMTNLEFNNKTLEVSKNELQRKILERPAIIIQDRGVIDNYFWYQMFYDEGKIDINFYEQVLLQLYQDLLNIDQLFIMLARPEIIILRDYINQIYLEARNKTTIERVTKLREGFEHLLPYIKEKQSSYDLIELDTSDMTEMETAIFIADTMMSGLEKKLKRGGGVLQIVFKYLIKQKIKQV